MTFDELLSRVIGLGKEIDSYWEREGRARLREYPLVYPDEAPIPPPSQQDELEKLLSSQPEERLCALRALELIGRIGGKPDKLAARYEAAREEMRHKGDIALWLAANPAFGLEVGDGLEKFEEAGVSPTGLLPAVALAG